MYIHWSSLAAYRISFQLRSILMATWTLGRMYNLIPLAFPVWVWEWVQIHYRQTCENTSIYNFTDPLQVWIIVYVGLCIRWWTRRDTDRITISHRYTQHPPPSHATHSPKNNDNIQEFIQQYIYMQYILLQLEAQFGQRFRVNSKPRICWA